MDNDVFVFRLRQYLRPYVNSYGDRIKEKIFDDSELPRAQVEEIVNMMLVFIVNDFLHGFILDFLNQHQKDPIVMMVKTMLERDLKL